MIATLLLALGASFQEPDPRPNIRFLFADDQRPDAVGAFGNESIPIPRGR